MSILNPYLNFNGNAGEALAFYHAALGGELTTSTYAEFGQNDKPEDAGLIMHGQLTTPSGFTLMGADVPSDYPVSAPSGFAISLSGDDDAELRGYWERLADGGEVLLPLEVAPWGDAFGQLTDRFGVSWMVNISGAGGAAAPDAGA